MTNRLGTRGYIMLLCAWIWGLVGLATWSGLASETPSAPHLLIPPDARAAGWFASALASAITCWSKRWSPAGLALLFIMPTIRVLSYLWSWVMWLIPGDPPGGQYAWYSAAVHLALIGLVVIGGYARHGVRDSVA